MITIENLSKKFGSKEVLSSIDLKLEPGKVYGIVGENGAGKTTLFRCIAGLESYDGTISAPKTPIRHFLGLLFTEPFFFDKITGKEYIQLLCKARGVADFDIEAKNIFDLPLSEYATNYSTGMKKKLAILAVLLQKNDYFILDEPFNGVDIQSNLLIVEIIKKLKENGKTVVISSHIFSTLSDTCDSISVLENGKITNTYFPEDYTSLEKSMQERFIGDRLKDFDFS